MKRRGYILLEALIALFLIASLSAALYPFAAEAVRAADLMAKRSRIAGEGLYAMDFMTEQLRTGLVARTPPAQLGGEIEIDEKRGEISGTNSVSAGSSTRIAFSSWVRNIAVRPRTTSDTPSHVSCHPPSDALSTRRTIHSASRITTRAPGDGNEAAWCLWPAGNPLLCNSRLKIQSP